MGRRSLARSMVVVIACTILGEALAYGRVRALTHYFGSGPEHTAFQCVMLFIELVLRLFLLSALGQALIPVLSWRAGEDEPGAFRTGSNVLNLCAVLLAGLALAAGLFGPYLLPLVYRLGEGATLAAAEETMRWLAPLVFVVGLLGVVTALLHWRGSFIAPSVAGIVEKTLWIVGIVLLAGPLGIRGVAASVVIGSALGVLICVLTLRRTSFRYHSVLNPLAPDLRRVFILLVPVGLAQLIGQATLVDVICASWLSGQAVVYLRVALMPVSLPLALFAVAIATTIFPTLSEKAAADDHQGLRTILQRAVISCELLIIPSAVGLIVLSGPLTRVLFETGKFGPDDVRQVQQCVIFYSPFIIAAALRPILFRVLYAKQRHSFAILYEVVVMVLNLAFNLIFIRWWGVKGIALSTSVTTFLSTGFLLGITHRTVGPLDYAGLARALGKIAFSAGLMGVCCWQMDSWLRSVWSGSGVTRELWILAPCVAVGVVVYFGLIYALGVKELRELIQRTRKALQR